MLVDSHCHLNFPDFKDKVPETLDRARQAGVTKFLTVNTKLSETDDLIAIVETNNDVWCSVGVHPHDAKDHTMSEIEDKVIQYAKHPKVVALGETGLDYYYDNSPRLEQMKSFEQHIILAEKLDLPLIIHTRDADADTINLLAPYKGLVTAVFHCFSGGINLAEQALDLGFFLSFSGIVTFKKAEEIREVVKFTPLNRLLVETDSPFLAPIPHRGTPNEPAYTRIVAQKIADIKDIPLSDIAKHTTQNFHTLFSKIKSI
ncbi:MAG: LuxR family transcriptional regulator [Alphaproteobacteria bacterium CG_4_10_14_0_8_um_filter_37_21]|nr:MAG: LuxR family transcriptional regulator [Alphaproteobacteria bacterium CG_4_10_14_0_8_um_filter_37_21]